MKKVIAILLALLLLGSTLAFAEEDTAVYGFSDPVLDIESGEDVIHLDFAGLCIAVEPVTVGEETVIALNILGNGETLLAAAFRIVGERMLMDVDGMDKTYSFAVPAMADAEGTEDALAGIDWQQISMTLLAQMKIEQDGNTMHFELPYTTLNELLIGLAPTLAEQSGVAGIDPEALAETFKELKENDSGVTVKGSFTQEGDNMSAELFFYLVESGVTAEDALAKVSLVLGERMVLDVDAGIATMNLTIEPETGVLSFKMKTAEQMISLSGVFGTLETELKVPALGDPEAAIPFESLGEEDMTAFGTELMMAGQGVLGFVAPMLEGILG